MRWVLLRRVVLFDAYSKLVTAAVMIPPPRPKRKRAEDQPSWYLVATEDKMIPPPAQRQMATRAGATIAEAAGSHAIYISKPEAVAALIAKATKGVSSEMAA